VPDPGLTAVVEDTAAIEGGGVTADRAGIDWQVAVLVVDATAVVGPVAVDRAVTKSVLTKPVLAFEHCVD
jgi:hypothetical protein